MPSDSTWPPVGFETRSWPDQDGDYRAAVTPPIAGLHWPVPAELTPLLDRAVTELTRYDASAEVHPMAAVLLRSESASSSQIEQITTTTQALAQAELGRMATPNADLVAANATAMRTAIESADRLDADAILTMHRSLLRTTSPGNAGRWRARQVWIGPAYAGPDAADYIPPHHHRIAEAIADLNAYLARDDVPVLVQGAIGHAQFESIHPFTDGNGRTGRALLHAVLRRRGVTRAVTVPLSAGLLHDVRGYFEALGAYRAGDPAPIVRRIAESVLLGVDSATALQRDLIALGERWRSRLTARRDSAAWRLLDVALAQPVLDAATAAERIGVDPDNVHRQIDALCRAAILEPLGNRARNRLWQAPEALALLTEHAGRQGRRQRAG